MKFVAIAFAIAAWACQIGANPLKLEIDIKPVMDTEITTNPPDTPWTPSVHKYTLAWTLPPSPEEGGTYAPGTD